MQDAPTDELTEQDRQQLRGASVSRHCLWSPVVTKLAALSMFCLSAQHANDPHTCINMLQLGSIAQAGIINQLRELVVIAEGDDAAAASGPAPTARTQMTPAAVGGSASLALRSPLLPPLSPPPADAEVAALEAEVEAAARRVAELRSSMQAQLQEQLAAKLAACRPSAELEPAGVDGVVAEAPQSQQQLDVEEAGQAGAVAEPQAQAGEQQAEMADATEQLQGGAAQASEGQLMDAEGPPAKQEQQTQTVAAPIPLSPQPAELRQRLASAADRMPALRARLEAATDRLQRVLAAVAADINRPPPNTVEKAVLGKTPGRPTASTARALAAEGENVDRSVSPLVQQVRRAMAAYALHLALCER